MVPHDTGPGAAGAGRAFAWLAAVGLLALLGYAALVFWVGLGGFLAAAANLGPAHLALMLALSSAGYALRFARWNRYLQTLGHPIPTRVHLRIYLAGFALTATPGKLGEALRSHLLKPLGVPYTHSLAALVSERMADVAIIALFALAGLTTYSRLNLLILPAAAAVLLLYLACTRDAVLDRLPRIVPAGGRLHHWAVRIAGLLRAAGRCTQAGNLLPTFGLGTAAWLCEVLSFFLLLTWMGSGAGFSVALLSYATATLAGALSFLPGGLGGTEAAMTSLLLSAGLDTALAVAATIAIRLTTLWFAVVVGLCSYAWHAVVSGRQRG